MEMENRYASNAKGNTGVALASAALGLGVLNGGLGNVLGGWGANNCTCSGDNAHINRYEAAMQAKISELETEVKLRDANTYTLGEVGKLRDYMENRFDRVEHEICDQKVFNATQIGTISCIQNQVAQLYGITDHITERIIPIEKVCPRPMARYNSWAAPSAEAATTPAG
jgi:hypothetical protein